jgi:hypothetical protein
MSTKDIRPTQAYIPCDICGRTLLRGERAEVFIGGGNRHQVCELCKPRALQEGWIREGSVPDYDASATSQDRRRSMFGRKRRTREETGPPSPAANLDDALSGDPWPTDLTSPEPPASAANARQRRRDRSVARERPAARERPRERGPRDRSADRAAAASESGAPAAAREPRHVHAVPTGDDSKVAAAVEAFNRSEHPRTVAGVARSLGAPTVAVFPDRAHPALVHLIASWELCWYRYEVDLGNDRASVRLDGQGYELSELNDGEQIPAALADDGGQLHVAPG